MLALNYFSIRNILVVLEPIIFNSWMSLNHLPSWVEAGRALILLLCFGGALYGPPSPPTLVISFVVSTLALAWPLLWHTLGSVDFWKDCGHVFWPESLCLRHRGRDEWVIIFHYPIPYKLKRGHCNSFSKDGVLINYYKFYKPSILIMN